ncbi:MAG: L,D-transpeptidase family protein [Chthoniobacterales bacterium]
MLAIFGGIALETTALAQAVDPVEESLAVLNAQKASATPTPTESDVIPVDPTESPNTAFPNETGGTDTAKSSVGATTRRVPVPTAPPPPPVPAALDLFSAIAAEDQNWINRLLSQGADPNRSFPRPAPAEFTKFYQGTDLFYYLKVEPGLTPLMFAAALGSEPAVSTLLANGAKKGQVTERSKTSALYLASRAGHIGTMQMLMGITPSSPASQYRIHVSLRDQRVVLWKGDKIVLFSKISSGKPSTPTETGKFLVTSKHRDHTSTLFDAKMPYFMRFSCGDFGLHAGDLPGYPASHGCIRMPLRDAREFYKETPIGTLVVVD